MEIQVSSARKEYLPWIDYAKAIGILLMIVGHVWSVDPGIRQFIYSFHMPLFFVIAGFLFKRVSFTERLKKDWRSLLLPYLIINGICLVIRWIAGLVSEPGYDALGHLARMMSAIATGESLQSDLFEPVCGPSWFFLAIFLLHMLFNVNGLHTKKGFFLMALASIISICVTLLVRKTGTETYGVWAATIMAVPFFCFGIILRKIDFKAVRNRGLLISGVAFLASTLLLDRLNGWVDINSINYGRNILIYYLCAMFGSLMIFSVSILLSEFLPERVSAVVGTMASGTIAIVGFHRFAIVVANNICAMTPIQSLIASVVIFFLFYPIIKLCQNYFPAITGFRTGGAGKIA